MYDYYLSFDLNKAQQESSKQLLTNYMQGQNSLLDAVCGAGKTEMLLETIKVALNKGAKVGFACPRKQLLIELYERIKEYFNYDAIGLVFGGYRNNEKSDFIFLTTHQLKKYRYYFDLLIIDEIDAFPFYDDNKLENDAFLASKQFIYLSATVPQKYLNLVNKGKIKLVTNYMRHHLKDMPIPNFKNTSSIFSLYHLLVLINEFKDNPLIIYVPTIKQGKRLEKILKVLGGKIKFVCSNNLNNEIIYNFRKRKIKILISTSVLERGITLANLNVIVYDASNFIFDEAMLIQISGRVGRDMNYWQGNIIFLAKKITKSMIDCRKRIETYNEMSNL